MKKSTASAVWKGALETGSGSVSTKSGVLKDVPYSFGTRFGEDPGTSPEELIAAAHAGCYSMALSFILGLSGITPVSVAASSTVTLDKEGDGFAVKTSHLSVTARIPGCDRAAFDSAVEAARTGCPISKLLNADITVEAKLEA